MIDFSKYRHESLYVFRNDDGFYQYALPRPMGDFSDPEPFENPVPFENLPQEIQERVAMLMTAPKGVNIKGVGCRLRRGFLLKDY